jgi:hypothetical protein
LLNRFEQEAIPLFIFSILALLQTRLNVIIQLFVCFPVTVPFQAVLSG